MARRDTALGFEAIRIEGALLSADFLGKVAEETAGQETAESYHLRHGLTLRDETGQAWRVAEAHWRDLEQAGLNRTARERILRAMFKEAFGWGSIAEETSARTIGERSFPLSGSALGGMVPVVFGDRDTGLDEAQLRFGDDGRKRSVFGLLQEFLNATDQSLWGVVTNGDTLRIARDNASLTRPAWIEADLRRIFSEQRYADFSLLWLLLHESRFGTQGAPPHDAILEQWRDKSLEQGTAARDRLRGGVEQALLCLGNGFLRHPSNHKLRGAMTEGRFDPPEFQRQLLRLIYRVIVLVVAEERELLHPPGSTEDAMRWYAAGYGIRRLRERAAKRRAYDRHDDLWDGARIVFRGCAVGEPRLALPGLGGLFAPKQCPDLDAALLGNGALLEAVYHLTWLKDGPALVRVNWRDMGTEELGSVYESLLELEPEIRDGAREYGFVGGSGGSARRLTGSYYTPDSLVQALLDSALDPLIEQAAMSDDAKSALLALSVIDPAMGSGHFLLGAARRIAGELARQRTDGTPGPESYRRALREVISHCIHGVDKNAMAVELARIALWLEAMEPGKPLAFLDHHLIHGDAILGILDPAVLDDGIPDEAFSALAGDDKDTAKQLKARNKEDRKLLAKERTSGQVSIRFDQAGAADAQVALDAMPDDSLEAIAAKQLAYEAQRAHEAEQFRLMCDAYVAAFLLPKTVAGLSEVPTTGTLRDIAIGVDVRPEIRSAVAEVAAETPFLHWPIAFAAVMNRGGFDCVLGNPPWKLLRQTTDSEGDDADGVAPLDAEDEIGEALSHSKAWFSREEFRPAGGRKDLYKLFLLRGMRIIGASGLLGMIVPVGVFLEAKSLRAREIMFEGGHSCTVLHCQNRGASFFPEVDSRTRFVLVVILSSTRSEISFSTVVASPQALGDVTWIRLSAAELARLSGQDLAAPTFDSLRDYHAYSALREGMLSFDSFACAVVAEFHASTDRELLHGTASPGDWLMVKNGSIHQFDVAFGAPAGYIAQCEVEERCRKKQLGIEQCLSGMRLLYRDIARSDDARTLIVAPAPSGYVSSYDTPMIVPREKRWQPNYDDLFYYLGFLNSFACDYCIRRFVDKHVKAYTLAKIAIPLWNEGNDAMVSISGLSRQIAGTVPRKFTQGAAEDWLRQQGVLSPRVFRLLALTRPVVEQVLGNFDVQGRAEIRQYGYEVTRPACLDAYDQSIAVRP